MNDRMFVSPFYSKPNVEYPCRWIYKVIGMDRETVRQAIMEVIQECPCEIRYSRSSARGKYHSFSLEVTLYNDEQRQTIYERLMGHPAIRIVL
jgi:putative lipoic acid-binding regulatory protein